MTFGASSGATCDRCFAYTPGGEEHACPVPAGATLYEVVVDALRNWRCIGPCATTCNTMIDAGRGLVLRNHELAAQRDAAVARAEALADALRALAKRVAAALGEMAERE